MRVRAARRRRGRRCARRRGGGSVNGRSRLFLASAGSGKTFQLTTHYLQLVCDGVRHDEVLATTFTRKAAGEILARILSRLAAGAASEAG
ncbi:MAG: UvrD-helicase domain-containing protein, partial [Planctomycetaceae bacterium]|nr:UvrD-helicase domain-containing protein [Planctomycetaceae bacterium]